LKYTLLKSDYVETPYWCAKDMIEFFKPKGIILDPCRGDNKIFYDILNDCDWCEIKEGKDFFEYRIIRNPPYSIFNRWIKHSYTIAKNIVYLLPTFKIYNPLSLMRLYRDRGGIVHLRFYDTGKDISWSRSRPIVASWFQKGYKGCTSYSYYNE
jgi:hypothetical protein